MIKGIIFDLDGVYFKNGKKNFVENVSSKLGVDKTLVEQVFLKSEQMDQYKEGKLSGDEFWNYAIKQWKIQSTPKELLKMLQQGYETNALAIDLIRRVKSKGIKAIICSNNFKERIEMLDERFDFLKDFDDIILSYEYEMLKPSLLKKVPEKTSLKPEEIVVIDDSNKNIEGAKQLGFQTILCEDLDKVEEYLYRNKAFLF
ncbi:MAG TPA: HAD-IA family hydrolase [Candidatus Nanoarchaeia archaeon]|nr:HAD-IA family hydrolase [Candidatus Nanoarchaeia archaeon]